MSILPRYALRKTKLGCVSMLIAVGFFLGGANELNVKADALPAQNGKTATVQSKAPSADYGSLAAAADSFTASVNEKSDHPAKASSLTATTSAASVAANVAADNSDSKVSCDALGSVQAEASTDDSTAVYQNSSALVSSSARAQAGAVISNSADSAQDPSMVMASAAQKVSEPPVVQSNATEPSLINTTGAVINDPSLPAEDVTVDAKNFNHYFDMHGTATDQLNSDGSVTITFTKKGQQYSAGGISLKEKINMDSSFTLNGQINLGNFGGADGMGIVFHTGSVDALGRPGGKVLKYGDGAQSYTVKLEHRHLIIGPSHYQDNGIPLPDNPAKTYQGVERNDLNQQTTRMIKYEFANGQPAAAAVSQPVAYTRSADIDEVTGDVVYTPWTAAPAKYPSIASPTIPGYFTNTTSVAAASPTLGQNPVVTVIYQPCTEKIRIVYEDVSTKDPQSLSQYDKLLIGKYGSSADYSTADTIKALERQGYQLVSDPTDGQVLSFNDTSERTYVIKLKRQSANTDHHASGSVKLPTSKPTDTQGKGTASTAAGVKTDDHQIKQQSSWQPIDGQADQSGKAHHVVIADSTSSAIQLTKSNNYDAVSAPNETASVKHLPQTGNRHADLLTGLGLLLAGISGWLGFDEVRRRFKRVLK